MPKVQKIRAFAIEALKFAAFVAVIAALNAAAALVYYLWPDVRL